MGYFLVVFFVALGSVALYLVGRSVGDAKDRYGVPRKGRLFRLAAMVGGPLMWGVVTIAMSLTVVPTGHVGIVYTFGSITGQTGEGLQWTAPWKGVRSVSVRVQKHTFAGMKSFTSESQEVNILATLNTSVSAEFVQRLFRDIGPDYFDVLIAPRVLQTFKDETVKYTGVNLAPNREVIRNNVRDKLVAELREHSITVHDLLIEDINFTEEFQKSIDNKVRAQQEALEELERVAIAEHRASQAAAKSEGAARSLLIEAKAQAEANRLLAESITPAYVQYMMVSKLNPNVQVMMVPSGQSLILDAKGLMPDGRVGP